MNDQAMNDIKYRVENLEKEVKRMNDTISDHGIVDATMAANFKSLETQFIDIKQDVISTLNQHSQRTWDLINKGIKVICVLVGIVCTLAGVKLLPEIIKLLGGL